MSTSASRRERFPSRRIEGARTGHATLRRAKQPRLVHTALRRERRDARRRISGEGESSARDAVRGCDLRREIKRRAARAGSGNTDAEVKSVMPAKVSP